MNGRGHQIIIGLVAKPNRKGEKPEQVEESKQNRKDKCKPIVNFEFFEEVTCFLRCS